MASPRLGKISEEMRRELSQILREVKDPRVGGSLVSITAVDVTPDLKYAKVFYSSLSGKESQEEVGKGLSSAAGFIRRELAHRLNLRHTPELSFLRDPAMERGAHISSLLRKVEDELAEADRREKDAEGNSAENNDTENDSAESGGEETP